MEELLTREKEVIAQVCLNLLSGAVRLFNL